MLQVDMYQPWNQEPNLLVLKHAFSIHYIYINKLKRAFETSTIRIGNQYRCKPCIADKSPPYHNKNANLQETFLTAQQK